MDFYRNLRNIWLGSMGVLAVIVAGWLVFAHYYRSPLDPQTQLSPSMIEKNSRQAGIWSVGRPEARLPLLQDIGGDFTLTGPAGTAISLQDYRGKVVLLYFGYTTCPDACPLTLGEMKQVLHLLGEKRPQVQPLFISFDPERDTPAHLRTYLAHFDPAFVGLTGNPEAIAQIAKQYQTLYVKQEVGSSAGYLFAHSSYLYLIDQQGRVRQRYRPGTAVQDIARDIEYLLTGQNARN